MILKIKIPHQMGSASFLQSVPYNNQTGPCQRQAHAIGIVKQEHNKHKHGWVWLPAFWLRESVVNCSLSVPSTNPLHCKRSKSKWCIHGNTNTQGVKEDNELVEWNYYWNSVPYPFSETSTAYSQKLCTFDNQMIQVQIAFHAWKHHLRLGNVCFLRGVPRHLQVLSECRKKCYWIWLSKGCSKNLKTRVLLAGLPSALTVACTNHFEQETLNQRWKETELDLEE